MRASRVLAVLGADENAGPNRSVDAGVVVGKRSLSAVPAKSCSSCACKEAELAVLKGASREQDGKVVLLKFQLEKRKKQCQQLSVELAKLAQLSLPAVSYPHSHSPDRQAWTQHWRRTQANLKLLRRSFRLADKVLVERRAQAAHVLNASTGTLRSSDEEEEEEEEERERRECEDTSNRTLRSSDEEEEEEGEEVALVDETVDVDLVAALQLKLEAQDDFIQRLRLQMQAWVVEAESLARPPLVDRQRVEREQKEEQREKVQPPTPSVRVALEDACPQSLIRKILEPASAAATPTSAPYTARTTTPRMLRGIFEGLGPRESSSPRAEPGAAEPRILPPKLAASVSVSPSPAATRVEVDDAVETREPEPELRAASSTPTTSRSSGSSFGSVEIRSAWAAWGARRYTQVASAATVDPAQVVVSPCGLTPGAFKQQMAHLRSENSMIRGEIQRFRADIRRLHDEQE